VKSTFAALGSLIVALGIGGCCPTEEIMPAATPSAAPSPQAMVPVSDPHLLVQAAGEEVAATRDTDSTKRYVVRKGDDLWAIASKSNVLGDSTLWPLLFRSNRDEIADPDLIETGQELKVPTESSEEEIARAQQEARDTPPYVAHTAARKTLPLNY